MVSIKYFILLLLFTVGLDAQKTVEVDLRKQRIYAKENGRVVFMGAISSGKRNHRTPRGTFRILGKNRFHRSNLYPRPRGGARMPYMQRLTYGGIAIHQGYLPGYPASHGCIRVSRRTAQKLWRWTRIGTKVTLHNGKRVKPKKRRYRKRKKYSKKRKYVKKRKYSKQRKYSKKRKYRKKRRYVKKRRYIKKIKYRKKAYVRIRR
jgi:hypothetical protein